MRVHVGRPQLHPTTVAVGEQLGSLTPALQFRDHLVGERVDDGLLPALPALRRVVEMDHAVAAQPDVALAKAGDSVRLVLLGYLFRRGGRTRGRGPDRAGERALAAEPGARSSFSTFRRTPGSPRANRIIRSNFSRSFARASASW